MTGLTLVAALPAVRRGACPGLDAGTGFPARYGGNVGLILFFTAALIGLD